MAISLEKGQRVNLDKNDALNKLIIGLGWDINAYDGSADFDLDVSVFLLNDKGIAQSAEDFIFYNNLRSANDAVVHMGDNRTGEGEGDDEQIIVEIPKLASHIKKLVFVITIHDAEARAQNFGQVNNAFVRAVNESSNEEILRYDLTEDFSVETALIAAELYEHNGQWKFAAVGNGFSDGLRALLSQYGLS
ncbi:MAG: TerD family protein [Bacteroidales bacterium]|nr:TerD family protein [Bacteroidales bacterium]